MPQGYKTPLHLLLTVCLWQDLIFLDVLVAHSFSKLLLLTLEGAKAEVQGLNGSALQVADGCSGAVGCPFTASCVGGRGGIIFILSALGKLVDFV